MKVVLIIICCSSFSFFPEPVLSQQNDRIVMAVLDFEAVDIGVTEVQEYSDYLSHLLGQTGMVDVISREQRERTLLEEELVEQDLTDKRHQRRIGDAIGADQIITGQIAKGVDYLALELRLIETESGRILKSISRKYKNTQELFDDCKEIVRGIVNEQSLPPEDTEHWLGLGLFSGYGTKIGEWVTDSSGGTHVPFGLYLEMGYISIGYLSMYLYFNPFILMALWEFSYGYRFKLGERIRVGPFVGFTLYDQGPEPIKSGTAVAVGLHLEVKALKHLQLNTRVHGTVPIYHGDSFINPFASALLYITVGVGYTFID